MARKVFWENPYQTELDTVISSVNGSQVTVESTIFFAFAERSASKPDFNSPLRKSSMIAALHGRLVLQHHFRHLTAIRCGC